jgi:hypothetical protein
VLQEEGFEQALAQIGNQYDFVETFPLVGHAVRIRRNEGALINPYLVAVEEIARVNKVIDTVSIVTQRGHGGADSSNNEIELSKGGGEVERINAVLPLFSLATDSDLRFFLRS